MIRAGKTFHAKLIESCGLSLVLIASSDEAKVRADGFAANVRFTSDYAAAARDDEVDLN